MERAEPLTGRRARLASEAHGSAVRADGNRTAVNEGMSQREHGGATGQGQKTALGLREFSRRGEDDFLLRGEWRGSSECGMVNTFDSDFDGDVAIEALWESLAALHPGDVLKTEHDRRRERTNGECAIWADFSLG
jgi:hypothetical protein